MKRKDKTLSEHLAEIGRKGGKATGERKRRGGSDYYSRLAKMRKKKPKGRK